MFERFAGAARRAVVDAQQEASWAGQDRIGSEHLLVSLLREPGPGADALAAAGMDLGSLRTQLPRGTHQPPPDLDADALGTLGIDLDAVRRATDAAFGPGALDRARWRGKFRLPFAPDAKQALVVAVRQAQQHHHRQISSGHLLLGVMDQPGNGALTLLAQAGADVTALRADVLRRLAEAA